MKKTLRINDLDNVAVALSDLAPGDLCQNTLIREKISRGHKFALFPISEGEKIIKYGCPIGHALRDIGAGEWIHSHNMVTDLTGTLEYEYNPGLCEPVPRKPGEFMGFRRADGRVGIRNELWILPLVGCVNDICREIEEAAGPMAEKYGLDGVFHFAHPYGCSQLGEDHENTRKILRDLLRHPNAGAVLCVALGCENNTLEDFREFCGTLYDEKVRYMVCQEVEDEVAEGLRLCEELCRIAGKAVRTACDTRDLIVGLKCGGSDGLSGITANPAAGAFTDCLVSMGGAAVLTEIPEMFGAESMLLNRMENRELFEKATGMINGFKEYFLQNGQPVGENPSPGNKTGGITTLEEKSLGCVQKGGTVPVKDVLCYGETVKKSGLSILCAPGNDLVSATALAAAGAQLILFTTGRGTPFSAPVPTLKIATNTELFRKKMNWIDVNAGTVTEGESVVEVAGHIMECCLETASGKKAKSELNHQHGMAIWKNGVTL